MPTPENPGDEETNNFFQSPKRSRSSDPTLDKAVAQIIADPNFQKVMDLLAEAVEINSDKKKQKKATAGAAEYIRNAVKSHGITDPEKARAAEDAIADAIKERMVNRASFLHRMSVRATSEALDQMKTNAGPPVAAADYEREITSRLKSNMPDGENNTYHDILLIRADDRLKILRGSGKNVPGIPGTPEEVVQASIAKAASEITGREVSLDRYSKDAGLLYCLTDEAMREVLGISEQRRLYLATRLNSHAHQIMAALPQVDREAPTSETINNRAHQIMTALQQEDPQKPNLDFYEKLRSYASEMVNQSTGRTVFGDKTRELTNLGIRLFAVAISHADPQESLPPPPITWEDFSKDTPAPHVLFEILKPYVDEASVAETLQWGGPRDRR